MLTGIDASMLHNHTLFVTTLPNLSVTIEEIQEILWWNHYRYQNHVTKVGARIKIYSQKQYLFQKNKS